MIQTIIYKYKIIFLKNKRNNIIYIANNISCLNYKLTIIIYTSTTKN